MILFEIETRVTVAAHRKARDTLLNRRALRANGGDCSGDFEVPWPLRCCLFVNN